MLFVVAGAPGAGKTAAAGAVRPMLAGTVVVDMDRFLDGGSALAGVDLREDTAADLWPAYDALCLELVGAVVEAGVDALLLTPLTPDQVDAAPGRRRLGPIAWALLDCPDKVRHDRLAQRRMDPGRIRSALEDARELRELRLPVLPARGTVTDTATAIATWVLSRS